MKNALQITKLLVITIILFFLLQNRAYAWVSGGSAKVEALLPDGERIPLPGVRIYRMDWWRYNYCNQGGRYAWNCKIDGVRYTCCFGDLDGVEVISDQNGNWSMSNLANNPAPVARCDTPDNWGTVADSQRCLSGPKGQIPIADDNRSCTSYNWCGFNCGSNPHRLEPYFPAGYLLPGNLEQLGYSITDGQWDPPFKDISVANSANYSNLDFTFVFLGANPQVETFDCRAVTPGVAFPTRVPSPTVPWSARLGLADKGGTAGKSNQEFENIIENWRQDKITATQISAFISNLARVPGLQKTICDPAVEGGCTGPVK